MECGLCAISIKGSNRFVNSYAWYAFTIVYNPEIKIMLDGTTNTRFFFFSLP